MEIDKNEIIQSIVQLVFDNFIGQVSKSIRKTTPTRIRFIPTGQFIYTRKGKAVWKDIRSAKLAFRNEFLNNVNIYCNKNYSIFINNSTYENTKEVIELAYKKFVAQYIEFVYV